MEKIDNLDKKILKIVMHNARIPSKDVAMECGVSRAATEARITEEQTPFISGEFTVSAIKSTKIAEIFWDETGDRWYLVKVAFITIDEKTAAEKRSISQILVQAANFRHALERFEEGMKGTMADYEIVSINETPIMDVYKMKVVE